MMQPRNALIPFELPQAANINALTQPLMQGIDTYRQGMKEQFEGERALARERMEGQRLAIAQDSHAMEREKYLAQKMGGLAQVIHDDTDQARAAANWSKLRASMPGMDAHLAKYGVDPNDHVSGARLIMGEAGKYQTANEREKERLGLQLQRSQIAGQGLQHQLTAAQLQQVKQQTPEWRMENAEKFGVQKGTPAWQQFVVSGQIPAQGMKFQVVPEGGSVLAEDPVKGTATIVHAGPPKVDATTKKAIDESDDFVAQTHTAIGALNEALRLNQQAYSGLGASGRASAANNFVPWDTPNAAATTNLENVVTNQALQSLRATFGGNPTEGERTILLEVAGSVNQPASVRADIYNRAMVMAQQRLQINQQKAAALRSGSYYQTGGQPPAVDRPVSLAPQGGPQRPQAPAGGLQQQLLALPDGSVIDGAAIGRPGKSYRKAGGQLHEVVNGPASPPVREEQIGGARVMMPTGQ